MTAGAGIFGARLRRNSENVSEDSDQDEDLEFDEAGNETYDRGANRLYVADTLDTSTPDNCRGHWVAIGDSDGAGNDGGNLDGDDF